MRPILRVAYHSLEHLTLLLTPELLGTEHFMETLLLDPSLDARLGADTAAFDKLVLQHILDGKPTGTLFLAQGGVMPAWKRWIGYTAEPQGRFVLDSGAYQAVSRDGKSLLAIGVRDVDGEFAKGEVVSLSSTSGTDFARGLSNYDARDSRLVAGKGSDQIEDLLGSVPYVEMVHRDNLVITV